MKQASSLFRTVLAVAATLGGAANAQQSIAGSCGQGPSFNASLQAYLTTGLNCPTFTSTFTGTVAVPRVDAPNQFDSGRIVLNGTSDLRLDGTNIFAGTAGISTTMTLDYELRLNGALIATATRNYTGGHAVVSFQPLWNINYPTLTATGTGALTPSQLASFVGTGSQSLSWKLTVTECVVESGAQQQVQLQVLGANIAACVELDGSSDFNDLGGASPIGTPTLFASGPALAGSNNALAAFGITPSFPVALAITDQQGTPVPIFGGIWHATPSTIALTLSADANGHLVFPFTWPPLPPGVALTAQAITIDPGSMSIVLSNGVRSL